MYKFQKFLWLATLCLHIKVITYIHIRNITLYHTYANLSILTTCKSLQRVNNSTCSHPTTYAIFVKVLIHKIDFWILVYLVNIDLLISLLCYFPSLPLHLLVLMVILIYLLVMLFPVLDTRRSDTQVIQVSIELIPVSHQSAMQMHIAKLKPLLWRFFISRLLLIYIIYGNL